MRMSSSFLRRAWPKIHAPLNHIPIKVGSSQFKEQPIRKRIEKLRKLVHELVQSERIEVSTQNAFEVRPYVDRIIQIAIEAESYENCDEETKEMFDFWMIESPGVEKLFGCLVPRYRKFVGSYTRMFKLPDTKYTKFQPLTNETGVLFHRNALLELKGNPYEPILKKMAANPNSLLNILVAEAKKANMLQLYKNTLHNVKNSD